MTQKNVPLRLNQFGGSFGEPLIKEQLFSFANYKGNRQKTTQINHLTRSECVLPDQQRHSVLRLKQCDQNIRTEHTRAGGAVQLSGSASGLGLNKLYSMEASRILRTTVR